MFLLIFSGPVQEQSDWQNSSGWCQIRQQSCFSCHQTNSPALGIHPDGERLPQKASTGQDVKYIAVHIVSQGTNFEFEKDNMYHLVRQGYLPVNKKSDGMNHHDT